MEALQKQQRIFTISFPLYLNFLSLKIKTVKERVFLYYLLQLKYKRVKLKTRLDVRLLADESYLRCESKNTM